MTFALCFPIIIQSEGGYVDNPSDRGGPTNLGVTIPALSAFLGRPATVADIHALTPETVAPLYEQDYYHAAGCDSCPEGLDLAVFDMAVNQGVGRAVRSLQTALGLTSDGQPGPNTRAAAEACDADQIIDVIAADREARYRSYADFPVFGKGWLTRLARTTALAHQMSAGSLAAQGPIPSDP